ncbi:MAG: peptidylprolyl isomerase [Nitrospiria bacterium]
MFKLSSKVIFLCLILWFGGTVLAEAGEEEREKDRFENQERQSKQKAVAEVNGQPILLSVFQEELTKAQLNLGHRELSPQRINEIKKEVLDQLITRELVLQKAKKEKIDPNDLVRKEVYEIAVIHEDEIKTYYQTHSEEFMRPEGVRIRHLLVRVDPSSLNEGWKAGYEKALDLSKRANQGEDFEELIKKYSDPEARYFGGDLRIQYKGQMAMTEFESAAFTLKEKEVSPPIQTLYGFSLIQVVEKIPPKPFSFSEINQEKVKKKLSQEKESKRLKEWASELKSQADIKLIQE